MPLDLRTRSDADPPRVVAGPFLDHELGAAFARRAAERPHPHPHPELPPLELAVDGASWTLEIAGGLPTVRPGPPDPTVRSTHVALTAAQFEDLVTDLITPIGLLTSGGLVQERGGIGALLDWWLVLRDALDDHPLLPPHEVRVPEDLGRSFTLDDPDEEIRAFLHAAGFVHLRGVFDTEEMARLSADMDAAAPSYRPGDGASWWAETADGTDRLVRMQRFEDRSPTAAALLDGPALQAIARITGCEHRHGGATSRCEALFKPLGVARGISDVPWHKDCSLGRHSYECARVTVGVSITGAGPTTGQLRVVAGSHRALIWPSLLDVSTLGLPDVPLATETGDVTLHLSCTLHMAQPPTTAERRVLYTSLTLPAEDPEAQARANRRMEATARETAPLLVSQPPAPT